MLFLFNATVVIDPSIARYPSCLLSPAPHTPDLRHCGFYLWPIHFSPITQHAPVPFISVSLPVLPLAHFCLCTSVVLLALLKLTIMFWVYYLACLRPLFLHLFIYLPLVHPDLLPIMSSYYIMYNFYFGLFLLAIYPLNPIPSYLITTIYISVPFISVH